MHSLLRARSEDPCRDPTSLRSPKLRCEPSASPPSLGGSSYSALALNHFRTGSPASTMTWTFMIDVLIVPVLALCAILPQPRDADDLLQGPVTSPALTLFENSSAAAGNISHGNVLKLKCDSVRYGRDLKVESCRKVFNFIGQDDTQTVFAERSTVHHHDLNLPFRASSNDARCYVQPVLAEGAVTARASSREVGNAAYTLFQECVARRGMGGIVGNIGGDNKLDVIIASYKPDLRCNTLPAPAWSSCVSILAEMQADKNRQTFGHLPDPRVQIRLPINYKSADRRCMLTIDVTGEPTGLSWYEVWEGAVALTSACVRGRQKCGKASGLGLGRNVFLQISDENPDSISQPLLDGGRNLSLLTSD